MARNFEDRQRIGQGTSGEMAGAALPAMRNSWFFTINITHIPTGEDVSFEGWVTQFSDSYNPQWNAQTVYGRMDPLSTYQGTQRTISLGFDIINESATMAKFNFDRIAKFLKFQYPVYESSALSQQNVLKAGPLLAIKWTNLISSPNNVDQKLVGYINGAVAYAPDMGEGGFMMDELVQYGADPDGSGDKRQIRNYIPKKVSLNFTFTVLHTHLVGWAPAPGSTPLNENQIRAGMTQTYIFGGDNNIDSRYPNIYKQFPIPEHMAMARNAMADAIATNQEAGRAPDPVEESLGADGQLNVPADPNDPMGANGQAIRDHITETTARQDADRRALEGRVTDQLRSESRRNFERTPSGGTVVVDEETGLNAYVPPPR